jgi:Fur family ferric uptake transcriptional regulator
MGGNDTIAISYTGVDVMSEETRELRKAGLKVTLPRLRILQLLDGASRKHVTADDVHRMLIDQGEDIGLATVYRVLNQFESAGLVRKHMFDDGSGRAPQACYELEEGDHHDHMVDLESGDVVEFFDEEIERLQEQIAAKHGYEIIDHSLVLYVRKAVRSSTG